MKVEEFMLEDASSPYKKWFDSLKAEAAAKVTVAKLRMERGLTSSIKWINGIGEYRIDWGPGLRIYLTQDGKDLIVLFGGGTKKGQDADIKEAKRLLVEYKTRKAALIKAEKEKAEKEEAEKEKAKAAKNKRNKR